MNHCIDAQGSNDLALSRPARREMPAALLRQGSTFQDAAIERVHLRMKKLDVCSALSNSAGFFLAYGSPASGSSRSSTLAGSLPSEISIKPGIAPRRSNSVCSCTAALVERKWPDQPGKHTHRVAEITDCGRSASVIEWWRTSGDIVNRPCAADFRRTISQAALIRDSFVSDKRTVNGLRMLEHDLEILRTSMRACRKGLDG